jgi:hypothetical protein
MWSKSTATAYIAACPTTSARCNTVIPLGGRTAQSLPLQHALACGFDCVEVTTSGTALRVARRLGIGMVGEALADVVGVVLRLAEKAANVVIIERVSNRVATSAWLHQAVLSQKPKLARDRGFRDPDE